MSIMFESIELFRDFVLSTDLGDTIFFTTDFLNSINIVKMIPRGRRVQEDIDAIVNTLRSGSVPIWFLVRMNSQSTQWSLGFYTNFESATSQVISFANMLKDEWFVGSHFAIHNCVREQEIWRHLFPQYALLEEEKAEVFILTLNTQVDPPSFQLEPSESLSQFCSKGSCCYIITVNFESVKAQLLNPDGELCVHCATTGQPGPLRAVYAFMKRELLGYLGQHFPNKVASLLSDINNCGELHSGSSRRRNTSEVLSPPTFGKYNQGESKRTRNFNKSPQPLFSN